jgi:hypothetical protein
VIDIELIKRSYASMADAELVIISKTARTNLSKEALYVLNEELQKRNLPVLFNVEAKQTETASPEENTYNEAWDLAFQKIREGSPEEDIRAVLKENGVRDTDAARILDTLPAADNNDEEFEQLIFKSTDKAAGGSNIVMIVILLFFLVFSYLAMEKQSLVHFIISLLVAGLGYFVYSRTKGELKSGNYWLNLVKNDPGKIVWIKPVEVKHTVGYVITLFRLKEFQLLTRENEHITIVCDNDEYREIFFRGIRKYLPHAHIGYTSQVSGIYVEDPAYFLRHLEKRRLYKPAGNFDFEKERAG